MIQQTFGFVPGPGTTIEWYIPRRETWRTGIFVRMIARGRRRGMIEIEPTGGVPRKRIVVPSAHVKTI